MDHNSPPVDHEGNSYLGLMPGLYAAIAEGRVEDFAALAEEMLEENPRSALLAAVLYGIQSREHPEMSDQAWGVLASADSAALELDAGHITNADIGLEFVSLLGSALSGDDEASATNPGLESILKRYDARPGSSSVVRQHLAVAGQMIAELMLQYHRLEVDAGKSGFVPRRSAEAALRYAEAAVVATLRGEPMPNVYSSEWDDGRDEGATADSLGPG